MWAGMKVSKPGLVLRPVSRPDFKGLGLWPCKPDDRVVSLAQNSKMMYTVPVIV